jgi:hypothetical protein
MSIGKEQLSVHRLVEARVGEKHVSRPGADAIVLLVAISIVISCQWVVLVPNISCFA